MHVCNLHLKSSHNDHSLYLPMTRRRYTTSILRLTAKEIYTSLCFILEIETINHNLSLSYIECGKSQIKQQYTVCVVVETPTHNPMRLSPRCPSCPTCSEKPREIKKKYIYKIKSGATTSPQAPLFLLELARNTRFYLNTASVQQLRRN